MGRTQYIVKLSTLCVPPPSEPSCPFQPLLSYLYEDNVIELQNPTKVTAMGARNGRSLSPNVSIHLQCDHRVSSTITTSLFPHLLLALSLML